MSGAIVGVEYASALTLSRDCDEEPFLALLMAAEQGMLAGVAKNRQE